MGTRKNDNSQDKDYYRNYRLSNYDRYTDDELDEGFDDEFQVNSYNEEKKNMGSVKGGKKNKKKHRIGKYVLRFFLVLLALFFVLAGVFWLKYGRTILKYQKEAKQLVRDVGTDIFRANQTSTIYDTDGNVITTLSGARDAYYIEYSDIPYFVRSALITSEDRKFYEHSGVDYKAILRACFELVKNRGTITQGGSTITQQLARNVFLSHKVSWERKIKEMFIARELEKKYSKDQILEFYINNIYFGNGYYGIQAASKGYFSKSVTELSLAEIAFICSIPNNPTLYDPYTNSDNTTLRKNRILKQMYEQGDIDKQMYQEALYGTIILVPEENEKNNYVETYVRYCATIALMENNGFKFKNTFNDNAEQVEYEDEYSKLYDEMSAKLYTGGYNIYTSIDLSKQELLQQKIDQTLASYTGTDENGVYEFQGAATCIDNKTGNVVAIVGGRTQDYNGYTLNRAYQSFRQPGSTIKPILDYTPLFEREYFPDSIVVDEPIENGPVNSPDTYDGQMTIRRAVEKSKNTVAWKVFDMLTPETAIGYLKSMNFKKIVPEDYVPAMSIGGMTYGVSTVEMASAYSTIENDGAFRNPTCITKIMDSDYNMLIDNTTPKTKNIYKKNATRMMTDILKGVLTNGTGKKYQVANAICAAKTGTTNGNKDVWFVGYSKYYTTSVWVGYDMPKIIDDNYGNTCSGTIWQSFMTDIHSTLPQIDFTSYLNENGQIKEEDETSEAITTEVPSESQSIYSEPSQEIGNLETTVQENTSQNQTEATQETTAPVNETTNSGQNESKQPEQQETTTKEGNTELAAPGGSNNYEQYWGE